jgi:hypothetical protein
MKNTLAAAAIILISFSSNAQLQGGTLDAKRKVLNETGYSISSNVTGTVILDLAVNRKGEVTSAKVIPDGTSITSTPQVMKAQNAAKKLKFTPGTYYGEFEHVRVKYTYTAPDAGH